MPLPVIAITNQSTVLADAEVQAVLSALQKQVSTDFKAYWDLDCSLVFWAKESALPAGWWQIVILDDPDMAGGGGDYERTPQGKPPRKELFQSEKGGGYVG